MKKQCFRLTLICLVTASSRIAPAYQMPRDPNYTNFIGMQFVRIEPGQFQMGFTGPNLPAELTEPAGTNPQGDFDEHPAHTVEITRPFYIGLYEVTNLQYELFDPEHKKLRPNAGAESTDDHAVINVNWYDAQAFCKWLSHKENLPYRLPTEAEWEYACRAGSQTAFCTGNAFDERLANALDRSLQVGQTPPNPWGLYDMHGNAEEWCHDWYGPYEPDAQINPVGRRAGNFRVTRGGSHSTAPYYLRSSNRMGTTPEDKHSLIGFRVVIGYMPQTSPLPEPKLPLHRTNVRRERPPDLENGPDPQKPYFFGPRPFIKIPPQNRGPLYSRHNHFISVTDCPNGDLLAIWHTCISESGRELNIAAARLRFGQENWEPASLFWDAPDRNDHGHALWRDANKIYNFIGLSTQVRDVALVLRTSTDNGATWSAPHIIADHGPSRMPVESVFKTKDGSIAISCDKGPNVLWMSKDNGISWFNPGGQIRGKHACAAQLNDGTILAYGRDSSIDGMMPASISHDMGKTYQYSASPFQPVSWGQRAVLLRLKEGPLFFASFCKRMPVKNAAGSEHLVSGLFAAASTDEGKTWPYRRLVTDDGPGREIGTMNAIPVTMDAHRAEAAGYLTVCQSQDSVINLLSSRQHYAFNLKWLMTPPPAAPRTVPKPQPKTLPQKTSLPNLYQPKEQNANVLQIPSPNDPSRTLYKIRTGRGNGFYIRSDNSEPFASVDPAVGFSAEIKTQIIESAPDGRGVDIELFDGAAARYALSITDTGVYWYEGFVVGSALLDFDQFTAVATGLDNTDRMHTFRLAVRPDRIVQIYRDGSLVGARNYEYRTPRDAYIQFGAGHNVNALVEYVTYDLKGPSMP